MKRLTRFIPKNLPALYQKKSDLTLKFNIRTKEVNPLFLYTVIIPTLITVIYFGLFASDRFLSESSFVIRHSSDEKIVNPGFSALLPSSMSTNGQDDDYTVHDFLVSRDALRQLEKQFHFSQIYSAHHIDRFSRFAGFSWDKSFEALYRYYLKRVSVQLVSSSPISTLQVRAYTAQEAYEINKALLRMAEQFVNNLNNKARQDTVDFAKKEVFWAESKAKKARLALSQYRNREGLIDPFHESTLQLKNVTQLENELINTENFLNHLKNIAPQNPQIHSLSQRKKTLIHAIDNAKAKIAGNKASFMQKNTEYERLVLDKKFADKQLLLALSSLQKARKDAIRKQLYLGRVVSPNLPDIAIEPHRYRNTLEVFILGLICFGILTLLRANIQEHLN